MAEKRQKKQAVKAFEKETDSTKIYAYSASIYALISCIAAIITIAVK